MKLPMTTPAWQIHKKLSKLKGHYLVAVSGGVDSLVLAQAAQLATRKNKKLQITALTINHNLQENSTKIAEKTVKTLEKMGLPTISKSVSVAPGNMEGNARKARYKAFEETLSETNAKGILLGHNMNDQAEQFFLGLARGSGLKSISGIPETRDHYYRPLLETSRKEILELAKLWEIEYWNDPHNQNQDYSRVRVRETIVPTLESNLGEHTIKNLIKTMEMAEEDNAALDYAVKKEIDQHATKTIDKTTFPTTILKTLPKGLATRIIHQLLTKTSPEYHKRSVVLATLKLAETTEKSKVYGAGVTISREGDNLVFAKNLVEGDIAELNPGDKVPKDGIIKNNRCLKVSTTLTGEPESKNVGDKIKSGTHIVSGSGVMLVTGS